MQLLLQNYLATIMSSKPHNYVRTYRRRSSLGQQDLAFLLGSNDRSKVCRYEQGHRLPSLRVALALASILDTSIGALYEGLQHEVDDDTAARIVKLRHQLEQKYGSGQMPVLVSRQLDWLEKHHVRKIIDPQKS